MVILQALPENKRPERGGWPGYSPKAEDWVITHSHELPPLLLPAAVPARVAFRAWFPGVRPQKSLSRAWHHFGTILVLRVMKKPAPVGSDSSRSFLLPPPPILLLSLSLPLPRRPLDGEDSDE
jgi:hypothetical protein